MHHSVAASLLLCLLLTIVECKLTCIGDNGQPVDM